MDPYRTILDALKASGVNFIVHIPDKLLLPLVTTLERDQFFRCVLVTREEEGVGVAAGAYLGGKKAALLTQSSGVGNSLNAISSLNIVHQIPLLLLVTLRGDLFEYNPADVPLGRALTKILEAIGVSCYTPSTTEQLDTTLRGAVALFETSRLPVAVILNPWVLRGEDL